MNCPDWSDLAELGVDSAEFLTAYDGLLRIMCVRRSSGIWLIAAVWSNGENAAFKAPRGLN